MTALKQFARIECPGVWRPEPEAQRREVTVSFGDTSLVITDTAGRALTHWSLAAVVRINPDDTPALFTPSAEATETLEIEDETMTEAIETVRSAIMRNRPRQGRLRMTILGAVMVSVAAVAIFWLPDAMVRHTVSVVPAPTRAEIGTALFQSIGRLSGLPCHSPRGDRALARLHTRLLAPEKGGLLVVPGGINGALSLPGGLILLNKALVEGPENPEVPSGYILAEAERRSTSDPLRTLLEASGPLATLRLLTTGHLPAETLDAYAETLVSQAPAEISDDALLARFAKAGVASTPYAYARDIKRDAAFRQWMVLPRKTFVVEDGGEILGSYYLKTNHAGPGRHVSNCGYMVAPRAQGRGLARAMCEHSQRLARELGYRAMQFNFVAASNEGAVALWKKLGFAVVGTVPEAFEHPQLGYVDALVMHKSLV